MADDKESKAKIKWIKEAKTYYMLSYIKRRRGGMPKRFKVSFNTREKRNAEYERLLKGKTCSQFKLWEDAFLIPIDIKM